MNDFHCTPFTKEQVASSTSNESKSSLEFSDNYQANSDTATIPRGFAVEAVNGIVKILDGAQTESDNEAFAEDYAFETVSYQKNRIR